MDATADIAQHTKPVGAGASPKRSSKLARREATWGYIFISPWLLGFLLFTLLPTIATIIFTFTDMKLEFAKASFIGFANYELLFRDSQVWSSLLVTIKFGLISLPVAIFAPLLLGLLMNSKNLFGKPFFRTGFYFPYIIPFVAAIFVWAAMLNPETGWINMFLERIGIQNPPNWVNDTTWVYPALVIIGIWGIGNAFLINLASLQGVPTELYDAAKIDGAGAWSTFWNVTFPMISPVIFYNLILVVVGLFQYFTVPLVLNQGTGAPGGATMFYNLYLYKNFFVFQNMAYGATLAWFLFLIILATTMVLFWTQRFWVYYPTGDRK
ncbi:MAG: sugar ABC transporter permease [Anaerolineales bacterium]|nr:sugar ABC transporter permease [Anaerolineales bacterium]